MTRPTQDEVCDRIDAWHDGVFGLVSPLEALGWSQAEYEAWVRNPAAIPDRPLPPIPN